MSKESAIALVTAFASAAGSAAWPQIDRKMLAAGLIDRINDPNQIAQRGTPMCGPAAFVRTLAIDFPETYAQMAIDLYTRGKARLGTRTFEPGSELRKAPPLLGTNPADWIMLASVRDSDNWFFSPAGWFRASLAGMTLPGTMESWLLTTGYSKVVNAAFLKTRPLKNAAMHADLASQYFTAKFRVMLLIDSNMLVPDHQNDRVSLYPDHWIMLDSVITDAGITNYDAPVSFSAYSWGGDDITVPVVPSRPLSKGNFLGKYYGFVAARW